MALRGGYTSADRLHNGAHAHRRLFSKDSSPDIFYKHHPHNHQALQEPPKTPAERRAALTWAQRLKRVFGIDIETCPVCGGALRTLACIEDPAVIEKILTDLDAKAAEPRRPRCRAPPQRGLFDCGFRP